ncbi:MAG: ATP-binding protein [Thermodesulfovibrionales bacterium]|jgi:two-component system sensor histidine kinase PilS (NtrC family)
MNEPYFLLSILLLIGLSFLFFISYTLAKMKKDPNNLKRREDSQVGFVVDTFHELVGKLKEKEKELEILHRKAEERADAIESYNEYILQSVSSGVISLDSSLTVTKVNSSAEDILEIRASDVIGKSYLDVFREPLRSLLKDRIAAGREETQYITNSGKNIHIGYTLTPLKGARKETIGQLLVFTDLTELKALESQAELRDRLSSLGEMAAGMAHELRNPMGVIAGYTKLLSKKIDPSIIHIVDSVSHEITVMDRIITDFLSFARPTELTISRVNLSDVITNSVAHLVADRGDIRVRSEVAGIPAVYGDEILLRQAFTNLIQNAVEAMPHGGDLRFSFLADANSLEIAISDSGHGISGKIQDKIFLPFYTTKDRGTGLGLAIVHKIVVSHRGSITVESDEQRTTFRVKLPLEDEGTRKKKDENREG